MITNEQNVGSTDPVALSAQDSPKVWRPKTTWTRCPIEGCGVRIKRNNLCCSYHWLIIANDETYFARYWKNPGFSPVEKK